MIMVSRGVAQSENRESMMGCQGAVCHDVLRVNPHINSSRQSIRARLGSPSSLHSNKNSNIVKSNQKVRQIAVLSVRIYGVISRDVYDMALRGSMI